MSALYSPWLAVTGSLAVGAAVVAPEMFRAVGRKITGTKKR